MGQTIKGKKVKRYYWLKLKEDFFLDKEVKKLRKIAGGDTYTIIYLKLMLLSMNTDGKLYFDGIEDTFAEELALEIDEDSENVRITLMYLEKMNLLQIINEDEIHLTQMDNLIGSESESAQRVRNHRARIKQIESENEKDKIEEKQIKTISEPNANKKETLQSNASVTECNTTETMCNTDIDIDIDIDIDKDKEKKKNIYKKKNFPPTVEEVAEYCNERGNGIDAQKFIDFYEATNWYRGKTKITNWKKCVNTWERNNGFVYKPKAEKKTVNDRYADYQ